MRDRIRLELTPAAYADYQRRERAKIMAELRRELAYARATDAEWYVWVVNFRRERLRSLGLPVDC